VTSAPCRRCGSTERYKEGDCAPCKRTAERARHARPEAKERRRARGVQADVLARAAARRASPENKARLRAIRATTEGRARARAYIHGTTVATLQAMHDAQRGLCAICRDSIDFATAHVDHDHATNEIRGLLCANCNRGLGHFRDSPLRLRAAAAYVDKHQPRLRLVAPEPPRRRKT